ncbi:unnamed protein product [Victoria cruziana]
MDGSTSEIEELSKIAERKLSIRSSNELRIGCGLQVRNPSSFSSSATRRRGGPATSSSGSNRGTCPPNCCQSLKVATFNLEKRCRSLVTVLGEVQFKGTLVDRFRSLETRILQLSYELDSGSSKSCVLLKATDEDGWHPQAAGLKYDPSYFKSSNQGPGKQEVEIYACVHQSPDHKYRVKGQKSASRHRNERKKAHRNWPYKRWFSWGC